MAAHIKKKTGRRRLARVGWTLFAAVLLGVGFMIWFGAWRYPGYGLSGISKADYARAMTVAARGMAISEGLTFEDFDFMKFREVERGSEAYAWGAARCRAVGGGTEYLWVYLDWSEKRGQWLRNYSLVLADPEDEIYYTRLRPGQRDRAAMALKRIWRMNRLHLWEVYGKGGALTP